MKTYEMYAKAIEDGKTYRASDMFYSRDKGFHDDNDYIWSWDAYSHHRDGYDAFLSEDGWEEVVEERLFTLEEIDRYINEYYNVVTHGSDTITITMSSSDTPYSSISKLTEYIFSKGRRA
jgi:hypothetical protein